MQRIALFIVLLGLSASVFPSSLAHAEGSPYDIKGVQVDALAESSVKARNKAFLEAQKKAFLVLAASYVSAEELPSIKPPADDVLSGLIQDFQIESEQVSTKRYLGVFDFRFKPAAVNAYFGHGPSLPDTSTESQEKSGKMLLLPYYQEGTKKAVFDRSQNPYWTSLASAVPKDGDVILPEGSISDMTDVGDVDPLALSATTLRRLMARYEVKDIAVALARIDFKNPQSVKVEFFKAADGHIEVANTIETTPQKVADETFSTARNLVTETATTPQDIQEDPAVPVSEIDARHFMPKGSRAIPTNVQARMQMIERSREQSAEARAQIGGVMGMSQSVGPRSTTLGGDGAATAAALGGQSAIRVFFNSMAEWLSIQKEIRQAESLTNLRITSLKTNQVDIVVSYSDWNSFVNSLGKMGMALEQQADKTFVLKRQSGQAF